MYETKRDQPGTFKGLLTGHPGSAWVPNVWTCSGCLGPWEEEEEEEEEEKEDEEERHSPHHVLFDFRDEAEEIRIGVGSRSNHVAVQFFVFFGS